MSVPTNFCIPDGRDLADLFMSGSSLVEAGYRSPEGLDVGQLFAAGTSPFLTHMQDTAGVDLGKRFRGSSDGGLTVVDAFVRLDRVADYALDFVQQTNVCIDKGAGTYSEYRNTVDTANVIYCLDSMRQDRRPTIRFLKGYTIEMGGSANLPIEILERPTTSNNYVLKYRIEETITGEHDVYFQVIVEFL